ncbi:MAG: hypothetical protein PWQ96_68 [Clostridia bacterium]|jgi:glycosyltransferase involved in cell wall biosynthesis|nr:waaE [Clostridiales bacterium]MDK2984426.1 hypothetical protein [Clostridia bacterium]
MENLSIVIVAQNEEKCIEKCLQSVTWAGEIIFIDAYSTDNTLSIAKKYTDKVFQKEWPGDSYTQKSYGISKATREWVMIVDADEIIPPELVSEIKQIIFNPGDCVGYWIPRKNHFYGKWIKHSGWYPDYQLRLFKRTYGRYGNKKVHSVLDVDGKVGYLKNNIIHYSYEGGITQFINKLNRYTTLEAIDLNSKGYKAKFSDFVSKALEEFNKRYFTYEGYKDGIPGFIICSLYAIDQFIAYAKLWERQNTGDSQ